jgi:hypothetical protein
MATIQGSIQRWISAGGLRFAETIDVTGDSSPAVVDDSFAARPQGTLSTRTDHTNGILTMTSGHGVVTGFVDLYWTAGSRHNVSATVSGTAITVTGGSGDNLPTAQTAVVVSPQWTLPTRFSGDNVTMIGAQCVAAARVAFHNAVTPNGESTEVDAILLVADEPYLWFNEDPDAPLAGETIHAITVTHGRTTAAALTVVVTQDGVTDAEAESSSSSSSSSGVD